MEFILEGLVSQGAWIAHSLSARGAAPHPGRNSKSRAGHLRAQQREAEGADVVSNEVALLKAMDDILIMADLPEPAERMHMHELPDRVLCHIRHVALMAARRSSMLS